MSFRHYRLLTALPRGVLIGLELLLVLAVIAVLCLTFALYRLAQGPVDVGFARAYIESALSVPGRGLHLGVGAAQISWPGLTGAPRLDLTHLSIDEKGQKLLQVRALTLTLAKGPLLIGRIRPQQLILRAPLLTLQRDAENKMHFVLAEPAAAEEKTEDISRVFLGLLFGQAESDFGLLSRIEEVSIEHARLRISDASAGMTWQLNDVDLSLRRVDVGVYGSVDVQLPNNQQFSLVMTYRREGDELSVTSKFRDFALTGYAGRLFGIDFLRRQRLPLTGSFTMKGRLHDLMLDRLTLEAVSERGHFEMREIIGFDLPVTGARLRLNYDRAAAAWDLSEFAFNLLDVPVRAAGRIAQRTAGAYRGDLVFKVDTLPLATLNEIWPDHLRDRPIAHWLTQKLSQATLSDIALTLPVSAARKNRQLTLLAYHPSATFSFKDLKADYHAPLFPVEGARGSGTYQNDALSLKINQGQMDELKLESGTTIELDDLTKAGAGTAKIHAVLNGPLASVLRYIALEPIRLGDKIPVPVASVKGRGEYTVDVSFPTLADLPADQVTVGVAAQISDLSMPGLVRGLTLAGGPYDLRVAKGQIQLSGKGTLGGRPIDLDWSQPIHPQGTQSRMQVTATLDSDDDFRRAFGADLEFLQGSVPGQVVYTEGANGVETIAIDADLTPARILFPSLQYEKPEGAKGTGHIDLRIEKGVLKEGRGLSIAAPNLSVKNGALTFGQVEKSFNLTRADLPSVEIGKSKIGVTYARDEARMKIRVTGDRLDLSPYMDSKKDQKTAPAVNLSAAVDSLYLGNNAGFRKATLDVALNTRADLERLQLEGQAGKAPAAVRYLPNQEGKMTLSITAGDAGAFLRAMNVYENMVGGTLQITGSPIGTNNRDVKGDLLIQNFAIVKAPVLAQLLGTMSIEGVGEQLTNKGLVFSRLESGFAWLRRPETDLMSFREGRTSGSSLGLTFDGLYNRRQQTLEVNGTIIPISGLNTFASHIPLLGQLLTGGKGSALIAATYSIKGPSDKPQIFVNPLSVLTPGILRRIFFESTPEDPLKGTKN